MPHDDSSMVFLTYISRSGSTYLSRLLDEYQETNVSLEARLPDDLHYGAIDFADATHLDRFLDTLYRDEKFCSWQIDRDVLKQRLAEAALPLQFSTLLSLLMKEYAGGRSGRTDIYKCGQYIHYIEPLREVFPQAQFIFVLRDIRAVFGSQKRSPDSTYGKPMSGSPVTKALMFNEIARLVRRYENESWFHLVKFEDLVEDPETNVAALVKRLGLRSLEKRGGSSYEEKIPEAQKHLHGSIKKEPQLQKLDGWRNELTAAEIAVFEHLSGQTLAEFGYPLSAPNPHAPPVFFGVHFHGLMYALRCLKNLRMPRALNLLAPCYSRQSA